MSVIPLAKESHNNYLFFSRCDLPLLWRHSTINIISSEINWVTHLSILNLYAFVCKLSQMAETMKGENAGTYKSNAPREHQEKVLLLSQQPPPPPPPHSLPYNGHFSTVALRANQINIRLLSNWTDAAIVLMMIKFTTVYVYVMRHYMPTVSMQSVQIYLNWKQSSARLLNEIFLLIEWIVGINEVFSGVSGVWSEITSSLI